MWPVAADYDEAIQNPHINFDDPELKSGEPEYDRFGSPAVRSGNFASVYMVQTGRRKVAVRCFLREVMDQQERYAAISKDLLGLGLPYTVNFEYMPKGIRVQGNWFPILKMDWCEGELLDEYIYRNLKDPNKLVRLADKWYEMSVVLRKQGIAHGDLQHGNVMVLEDELRLIDYDGMFVPRLAGRQSNERGLEHYQHPGRGDQHFGRYLDNFSNWVIYTTLLSLGEDTSLWNLVNLQDKHLIFKKSDYDNPQNSTTFRLLKNHQNRTLATYAITLEHLLLYDVEKVPDFNPDRPVLYPPENVSSSQSRSNVPVLDVRAASSDRGQMFDRQSGDKGRMFDRADSGRLAGSVDKGRLHEGGDRGSLYQDKGRAFDRGPTPAGSKLSVAILAVAAVLLVGLVVGGWVLASKTLFNQPTHSSTTKTLSLGISYAKDGDRAEARKYFQQIIDDNTADAASRSNAYCMLGLTYAEQAGATGDRTKLKDALKYLNQAIDANKDNAEAWYSRGRIFAAMKNVNDAERDYKQAKFLDAKVKDYASALQELSN